MNLKNSIIWLLLAFMAIITELNSQGIVLPVADTINIDLDTSFQKLPLPKWVLKEEKVNLDASLLQKGDFSNVELISLHDDLTFGVDDVDQGFWYRYFVRSSRNIKDYKLTSIFKGGNGAFIKTTSKFDVYYFVNGVLTSHRISGYRIGATERDIDEVFYPSMVTLDLKEDEVVEIWIRSEVGQSEFFVQLENHVLSNHVDLKERYGPDRKNIWLGGVLFTMLVIGLVLYLWIKETVYLWFLAFLAVNFFSWFSWMYSHEIISSCFSDNPYFFNTILIVGDLAKFIATMILAKVFIQTKKNFPKTDKLFVLGIVSFILITATFVIFFQTKLQSITWLNYLMLILGYSSIAIIILCFVIFIFSSNKLARFYSIGAITPFLGMVLVRVFGWFRLEYLMFVSEFFIGSGPVLALGLAMLYRFKLENQKRIDAENARRDTLRNINEKLEQQVRERTDDLTKSMNHLKATQDQLILSEKMASLGELTAGIAHEIQNPLNFVNNFSDVSSELIDEAKEELEKGDITEVKDILDDLNKNLEKISHHGGRASSIVKGMLDHSKESSGIKEPTDVNALCDEYIRLSYHGLKAKDKNFHVEFDLDLNETLPKAKVIPQDIGRVLLNVFNNAFYAVSSEASAKEDKPNVIVSTEQLENKIQITITDNGTGMSQETLEKVFQPFFTTKPTGEGTGLGMSISYDIITKGHGGQLKAESKEGEGSKFTIILPIDN